MPPATKKCAHCGEVKDCSQFSASKSSKDGLQSWCKSCSNQWKPSRQPRHDAEMLSDRLAARDKADVQAAVELLLDLSPRVRAAVAQQLARLTKVRV